MLSSVVACRDDQRVVGKAVAFQGVEQLAEHRVALQDPVAVFRVFADSIFRAALAGELSRRNYGRVRRAHRKVQKEWLVRARSPVDPVDSLADHQRLILDRLNVRHDSILLDDRSDIASVRETVEVVKAQIVRAFRQLRSDRHAVLGARFAIRPVPAQMPLANARGLRTRLA